MELRFPLMVSSTFPIRTGRGKNGRSAFHNIFRFVCDVKSECHIKSEFVPNNKLSFKKCLVLPDGEFGQCKLFASAQVMKDAGLPGSCDGLKVYERV